MKLSVKSDYATRAVLGLARHFPTGSALRVEDLAASQSVPANYLVQILIELKGQGIAKSIRGKEGGYLLARRPESITVGQVVRFLEGSQSKSRGGRGKAEAPFTDMWNRVDEVVSSIIDHTSFAELVRTWAERQAKYIPNWDI